MCQPTWRRIAWERYMGETFHGKCYTIRCTSILTPFQFELADDDRTEPMRSHIGGAISPVSVDNFKPTCTACASLSKKHGSFSQWNEWSQQHRTHSLSVPHVPCNKESIWRYTYGDVLFAPCMHCMADCSVFTYLEHGAVACDACRAANLKPSSNRTCRTLGIFIERCARLRAKIMQSP